ncbi:hypothetical protein MTX78_23625 (plasmid) [Hymenobacter tibetensis]|uniref:Uncharacterized protein n=1 Tax=Hymenobacter tibetensis TaxID=497967 RepID=A0ABY4D8B2_9BACT|nr:hypothetical protein [Hymenobacter tibetensis]UOG77429.1 hypothetical protein MTX78_23625 [Hymenobacter tibetensis]
METTAVVTGAAFADLLSRLRRERPSSSVYFHTNIVTNCYYLLSDDKRMLAATDYHTAAFYTLAFRAQIASIEGDDFHVVLPLEALDDRSGVPAAEFALQIMQHIAAPPPRKPRGKKGKN